VQQVTRSFLGQVMTARPCAACQGFGSVIPHPCPECGGDGRVRTRRTLKIKVPAGVDTGTRIQLSGEGEAGPGGGPAGDLFVEIVEQPHPIFQRNGDDLHATVALPMAAAALGTSITVQTLDGERSIDLRPGVQSGQTETLPGLGVTHLRGQGRGDLIVHIEVQTPTRLDAEQEDLLRKLASLRGEDGPDVGTMTGQRTGLFSRLRDAFSER
jgi:molecular chaperone DnaJ